VLLHVFCASERAINISTLSVSHVDVSHNQLDSNGRLTENLDIRNVMATLQVTGTSSGDIALAHFGPKLASMTTRLKQPASSVLGAISTSVEASALASPAVGKAPVPQQHMDEIFWKDNSLNTGRKFGEPRALNDYVRYKLAYYQIIIVHSTLIDLKQWFPHSSVASSDDKQERQPGQASAPQDASLS
jgi:hypothetical protein